MATSDEPSAKERIWDLATLDTNKEKEYDNSLIEKGVANTSMLWNNLNFNINENNNEVPDLNIKKEPPEDNKLEIKAEIALKIEDCFNNNKSAKLEQCEPRSLPFSCTECDFQCGSLISLHSHMSVHSTTSLFSCPICTYRSNSFQIFDIHLRFHKGETLYACPKCEYLCRNRSSLRKHIAVHSDLEMPFQCLTFEFILNKNIYHQLRPLHRNGYVLIHKDDSLDYLSDCDEYEDDFIIKEEDLIDITDLDPNVYNGNYEIKSEFGKDNDFLPNNNRHESMKLKYGKSSFPIINNPSFDIKPEPIESEKDKSNNAFGLEIANAEINLVKSEVKTEKFHSEGTSKLKWILESRMNKKKSIYNFANIQQPNILNHHKVNINNSHSRLRQHINLNSNFVSPHKQHVLVPSSNTEPVVMNQSLVSTEDIYPRKLINVENKAVSHKIQYMQESNVLLQGPIQNETLHAELSANLQHLDYYKMSHTGEGLLHIQEQQPKQHDQQHLELSQRKLHFISGRQIINQKQPYLQTHNQQSQQVQNIIQQQSHYHQPLVSQNPLGQNHQQESYQPHIIIHPQTAQLANHVQQISYHEPNPNILQQQCHVVIPQNSQALCNDGYQQAVNHQQHSGESQQFTQQSLDIQVSSQQISESSHMIYGQQDQHSKSFEYPEQITRRNNQFARNTIKDESLSHGLSGNISEILPILQKPAIKVSKYHQCTLCENKYKNMHNLKNHMMSHTGERPFSCPQCEYKCRHKANLKAHLMTHTGIKPFACTECEYKSFRKFQLKNHMMTHTGERPYACTIEGCEYRSKSNYQLKKHIASHSRAKEYRCKLCEFKSITKNDLDTHIEEKHQDEDAYGCKICDYTCKNRVLLKKHNMTHTDERPFSCPQCWYKCKQSFQLKMHMRVHTGEKPHACTECDYKCRLKSSLQLHMINHTGELPYKCDKCDYTCKQKISMLKHEEVHSGEKAKQIFTCTICNYECATNFQLKKHTMIHTGEKPFECSHCSYKSKEKYQLKVHMAIHTGEKPFKCDQCDYKCARRNQLKLHTMTHTGEKPFVCSQCDHKCTTKAQLKTHIASHTSENQVTCKKCKYKCNNKDTLLRHMKKHSRHKSNKTLFCDSEKCEYKTTNKQNFKQHWMTHTGEKPFGCKDCSYKCTSSYLLKRHMMTHTGEKPYACTECDFTCTQNYILKKHIKSHKRKTPFSCKECDYRSYIQANLSRHTQAHKKTKKD